MTSKQDRLREKLKQNKAKMPENPSDFQIAEITPISTQEESVEDVLEQDEKKKSQKEVLKQAKTKIKQEETEVKQEETEIEQKETETEQEETEVEIPQEVSVQGEIVSSEVVSKQPIVLEDVEFSHTTNLIDQTPSMELDQMDLGLPVRMQLKEVTLQAVKEELAKHNQKVGTQRVSDLKQTMITLPVNLSNFIKSTSFRLKCTRYEYVNYVIMLEKAKDEVAGYPINFNWTCPPANFSTGRKMFELKLLPEAFEYLKYISGVRGAKGIGEYFAYILKKQMDEFMRHFS